MDFTFELSKTFGALPFEIFKQDKDEVIMLINYLIEKSEKGDSDSGGTLPPEAVSKTDKKKDAFWEF